MIKIIQRRKIWFAFSLALFIASLISLSSWGLKLGIDFTGGTLMEFSFKDKVLSSQEIKDSLKDLDLGEINIQFSGERDVLMRLKDVDEDTHQKIVQALSDAAKSGGNVSEKTENNGSSSGEMISPANEGGKTEDKVQENTNLTLVETASPVSVENVPINNDAKTDADLSGGNNGNGAPAAVEGNSGEVVNLPVGQGSAVNSEKNIEEKRFDSIGPVIGNELKSSAIWAIAIALVGMILYIAWAFRKVSYPISSFKYGVVADIALFHDVIITLGIFSFLGHYLNVEIGLPFVAAILAVLGYSVNDTIVVFDRTRENLLRSGIDNFEEVVNKSVNETMTRSINTTFTTLIVLFSLYLFGGESIRYFIVALMVGIFFGTYSSIFIASPLLVTWHNWDLKRR